jgi:hypothetical protein
MRLAAAPPSVAGMEGSGGFGTTQLFLSDSRLVLAVLNHLRYQALNRAFGVSREQANVLTFVLLAGVADGAYVAARKVGGVRLRVSPVDAAVGAIALRDAALGVAGPSDREIPRFGTLVAFAMLGGLAAPGIRRIAHGMHVAEQRLRATESRVRHATARDRMRASTGTPSG